MELERCLWCCRAASVTSRSRLRVLGTLSSILFSRDRTFSADSPTIFQTLLQALFSLKYYLSLSPHSTAEMESLSGYISAIRSGSCGEISSSATEMEFGVRFSKSDSEEAIRDVLVTESVIRCLEVGDGMSRRWMLRNMLEVSQFFILARVHLTQCTVGVLANTRTEAVVHASPSVCALAETSGIHVFRFKLAVTAV